MKNTHRLFPGFKAGACAGLMVILMLSPVYAVGTLNQIETAENEVTKYSAGKLMRPVVAYTATNLRDPFQGIQSEGAGGVVVTQQKPPDLVLQGVVWGGPFPQAIINNDVHKIGDVIQDARVVDIGKDGVTMFFGGRQYMLNSPVITDGLAGQEKPKTDQGGKQ